MTSESARARRPRNALVVLLAAGTVLAGLVGAGLLAAEIAASGLGAAAPAVTRAGGDAVGDLAGSAAGNIAAGTDATGAGTAAAAGTDAVSRWIAQQQAALRANPGDYTGWAALGAADVHQARFTADPTWYPKADGALRRSLGLNTAANDGAMTGLGSLANARHDVAAARIWARRALAINPTSAAAYGVLTDALTQLGDYPGATAAVQRMVELKPGVSSFTRASDDFEERGDVVEARAMPRRALADATDPSDLAVCHQYLGELDFNNGASDAAAREYALGRAADPAYPPLLEGKAKAEAALGHPADAIRDYTELVDTVPQPRYVIELGELLQSTGRTAAAADQYALLATELKLFAANGVTDDPTTAAPTTAAPTTAAPPSRWPPPGPSGRGATVWSSRTRWPGPCTRTDGTARRSATRPRRPGWAGATRCSATTAG